MPKKKLPFKKFKWTPDLAYVVGLLVTDGNLSQDGRHITMRSVDLEMMKNFKKCLGLSNTIGDSYYSTKSGQKKAYRVQFGNVQFYKWLVSIGVTPAKTYTIGEIKIPDRYYRDFLRGHLDGDGSIICYTDKYNTFKNPKYIYRRLYTKFVSANRKHIIWLRKKVNSLISIQGHPCENRFTASDSRVTLWGVRYGKKESLKLLSWLYYDPRIPCLTRKREKFENFLHEQR